MEASRHEVNRILLSGVAPALAAEMERSRRDAAVLALFAARDAGFPITTADMRDILDRVGIKFPSVDALKKARRRAARAG